MSLSPADLCLQFVDRRINHEHECESLELSHNERKNLQLLLHHLQRHMSSLSSSGNNGKSVSVRATTAGQHNTLITLYTLNQSSSPPQQLLLSLTALLHRRSAVGEEEVSALPSYRIESDTCLELLVNIAAVLRSLCTARHVALSLALLRAIERHLQQRESERDRERDLSRCDAQRFLRIVVLRSIVHTAVYCASVDVSIAAEECAQIEREIAQLSRVLSPPVTETHTQTQRQRESPLWSIFLKHESLQLELQRVHYMLVVHAHRERDRERDAQSLAAIEKALTALTDVSRPFLQSLHDQRVSDVLDTELQCLLALCVCEWISSWEVLSSDEDQDEKRVSFTLTGSRLALKITFLRARFLVAQQQFSAAQSLLQSMLNNPHSNAREQAIILHNMTLFRPWTSPHALAELTYGRALALHLDAEQLLGRVEFPATRLAATSYNLGLTLMKTNRFCEAFHLLAMLQFCDAYAFSTSPLYYLRLGECCVHHQRVLSKHQSFPRYRLETRTVGRKKFCALIRDQAFSIADNLEKISRMESTLEEMSRSFQAGSCSFESARKYLAKGLFFAQLQKNPPIKEEIIRRIGENLMFVCANLKDSAAVQLYGKIMQQRNLHNSDFYLNYMSKALLDQGKSSAAKELLESRLNDRRENTSNDCIHVINAFQTLSLEELRIKDSTSFTKLILLTNLFLLQTSDIRNVNISRIDEVLKLYPQFTPIWTMKMLRATAEKDIDRLNALLTSYYQYTKQHQK